MVLNTALNTENNPAFAGGSTISKGQSFFVRTYKNFTGFTNPSVPAENRAVNAPSTTHPLEQIIVADSLVFRNKMRTTAPNTTFSKITTETLEDKLWLNLTDSTNYSVQLGIYFKPTGNAQFVQGEDVTTIHGRKYDFYTQATTEDLIIDVQNEFDIDKVIPLGILNISDYPAQIFTISIPKKGGVFNTQTVYLEDTLLGVIHNLSLSNYSFSSTAVVTEERFKLLFSDDLSTFTNKKAILENEILLKVATTLYMSFLQTKKYKVYKYSIFIRQIVRGCYSIK